MWEIISFMSKLLAYLSIKR